MTLRPALPTDLPAILEMHTHSLPDHSHAIFTHPFRQLHPESFEEYTSSSPRKKLLSPSPNEYNIVITEDEKVVAWAFWRRSIGEIHSSKIEKYKSTSTAISNGTETLESLIGGKEGAQTLAAYPSLSIPRQKLCNLHTLHDTVKYFSNDHYYLSHLLVLPSHKRKGYGTLLTLWGLHYAYEEKMPVYLTASAEGERLYEKLGFKVIGERSLPSIEEMDVEDRRREEEILGKDVLAEQFRIARPKMMVWESSDENSGVFGNKEFMEKIIAVPFGAPKE
ncbi:hypothetical protein TWF281_001460 [Arthrobotrys megalospora]